MNLFTFHLTDDRLAELADEGEADASSRERRHLRRCGRCQRLLEGHRRAATLLQTINPTLPLPRRPVQHWALTATLDVAAAALVIVVVAIVAANYQRGPASASNSPAPPSPAAASSLMHSWLQLTHADTASAWWSPDSQWLLVSSGVTNGTPDQQSIALRDRTGRQVRTMPGERAVWVDAHTFIVVQGNADLVGSVDSSTLTRAGPPIVSEAVSNGHGAVAFSLSSALDATSSFAVWTSAGTSPTMPGVPVAWSPDGTRLAIWHWTKGLTGPTVQGWVEVSDWPGLHSEIQLKDNLTFPSAREVQFDPAGSHLYVNGAVLDLTSGRSVGQISPHFAPGTGAWNSADQFVVPSLEGGNAAVFDVTGHQVAMVPGIGDSIASSADGSLLVSWTVSEALPIALIHGSTVADHLVAPGPISPPGIVLSPDGSALVAVWAADNGIEAFLLQR